MSADSHAMPGGIVAKSSVEGKLGIHARVSGALPRPSVTAATDHSLRNR
jgi:hypothetical protein